MAVKTEIKTPLQTAIDNYRRACNGYDTIKSHPTGSLTADQQQKRRAELSKALREKREAFGEMVALNGGRVPQLAGG